MQKNIQDCQRLFKGSQLKEMLQNILEEYVRKINLKILCQIRKLLRTFKYFLDCINSVQVKNVFRYLFILNMFSKPNTFMLLITHIHTCISKNLMPF